MNWYIVLKGLYERGKIDEQRLENAVGVGLITQEQKEAIMSQ